MHVKSYNRENKWDALLQESKACRIYAYVKGLKLEKVSAKTVAEDPLGLEGWANLTVEILPNFAATRMLHTEQQCFL